MNIMLYLILFILLTNIIESFKVMKIIIPDTSGLNVVDRNFQPKYFIKNKLRFVTPYIYTYKLFAKKRWIDKKIVDVLTSEFCAYDMNYFLESIKKGYIKVNNKNVSNDYIIKNNDFIEHKLLLFEKPVLCNKIIILHEDENFICVYKPSSLPTHPVGFYQYNSLLRILQNYLSISKKSNTNNSNNSKSEDVIKINFDFKKTNFKDSEIQENNENCNLKYCNFRGISKEKELINCNHLKNGITKNGILSINLEKKNSQSQNNLSEEISINEAYQPFSKKLNENDKSMNELLNKMNSIKDKESEKHNLNEQPSICKPKNKFSNYMINKTENLNCKTSNKPSNEFNKLNEKIDNVKINEKEDPNNIENLYIYTLHRLDKLTSGIVLFGKNKKFSTSFSEDLSNNKIKKTYITRVVGDFRKIIKTLLDENKVLKDIKNENLYDLVEQYCNYYKNNNSLKYNDSTFFKNDVFLYENNYKRKNLQNEIKMKKLIDIVKEKRNDLKDFFDISKYIEEDYSNDKNYEKASDEEINNLEMYHKYFVIDFGYMYCEDKKLLKYVFTKYNNNNSKNFCEYSLKPSITKFMFLSYNSKINESLIFCQPITGRTHQIRAHLNSLSFPISNDPQYNKKFEENYIKKSNYIYFDDDTYNKKTYEKNNKEEEEIRKDSSYSEKYHYFPLIPFLNTSFNWLYDESIDLNNEYNEEVIKNYFFKKISNITYHSSGIFLHSFRYEWKNVFDVFTLLPNWCHLFYIPKYILTFLLYGDLS